MCLNLHVAILQKNEAMNLKGMENHITCCRERTWGGGGLRMNEKSPLLFVKVNALFDFPNKDAKVCGKYFVSRHALSTV